MLGEAEQRLTPAQKTMQDGMVVQGYAWIRDPLTLLSGGYTFGREVQELERTLDLVPGDMVLDVACGHGNFTAAIAKRVAPGLVLGIDISRPMLERATRRMDGEDNVLLVRGDVHNLPFRTDAIAKVNCSAGFCQFPDLDAAIENIHRVLSPAGRFTGSCFARSAAFFDKSAQELIQSLYGMRFIDLVALGAKMGDAGFAAYASSRDRWFGYFGATKSEVREEEA
jgi:ubiquinone/menaquinone biosynthesis C-methylase UbiE